MYVVSPQLRVRHRSVTIYEDCHMIGSRSQSKVTDVDSGTSKQKAKNVLCFCNLRRGRDIDVPS
jgi:hypothetical protein